MHHLIFWIPLFLMCNYLDRRNGSFGQPGNLSGVTWHLHLILICEAFLSIKSYKRKEIKKKKKKTFPFHTTPDLVETGYMDTRSEILAPLKLMAKFPLTSAGPGFHPLSISSSTRSRKYWKALDRACSHGISSPNFQTLLFCIV